jgi:hypothetical protein
MAGAVASFVYCRDGSVRASTQYRDASNTV